MQQPSPLVMLLRRVFVLGILALIIWGIVSIFGFIGGLFNHKAAAGQTSGQVCAPNTVVVRALVGDGSLEKASFAATEQPMLWFTLTNNSKVTCDFNGGPRVTFFTIKSGTEQIWTSRDCSRVGLTDKFVTLKPGQTLSWPANSWYRVHSSTTGCGTGQTPVLPGAYSLTAEVNGVISSNYEQFILQ